MTLASSLLSRRTILKTGAFALCGLYFPRFSLAAQGMTDVERAKRRAEYLELSQGMEAWLRPRLGAAAAKDAAADSVARFEQLLPVFPYIGENNRNQESLIQAGWLIAISKAVKAKGLSSADAGRILYDLNEQELASAPAQPLLARGAEYFSERAYAYMREWTAKTRERRYPGDWVATAVFGDGKEFDVGQDYAQCGALSLFQAHGEAEVAPYFCLNDFLLSRYEGTGLQRVHTLAQGDALCDFRYKKGRPVSQNWETETPRFPAARKVATPGKS